MTSPTTAPSKRDQAVALQVALPVPDTWRDGCVAWVDSKDAQCRKPRKEGLLCTRHHNVAEKRFAAEVAKREAQAEKRAAKRREQLPQWRAELERVRAEIERRDPAPHPDRAAYGGAMHPSIRKQQLARLSDSNVQRMGELVRRHEQLEKLIGDD